LTDTDSEANEIVLTNIAVDVSTKVSSFFICNIFCPLGSNLTMSSDYFLHCSN
jgi:hypothetical protein